MSGKPADAKIRGRQVAMVVVESICLALMLAGLAFDLVDQFHTYDGEGVSWLLPVTVVVLMTASYVTLRLLHYQAVAEARVRDALGGCLACYASEVRVEGDRLHCGACGYVGGADRGGGDLTPGEEEAVDSQEVADEVALVLGDP